MPFKQAHKTLGSQSCVFYSGLLHIFHLMIFFITLNLIILELALPLQKICLISEDLFSNSTTFEDADIKRFMFILFAQNLAFLHIGANVKQRQTEPSSRGDKQQCSFISSNCLCSLPFTDLTGI